MRVFQRKRNKRPRPFVSLSIHGFRTKCLRFIFHVPSIQHAYTYNVLPLLPSPNWYCYTRGRVRMCSPLLYFSLYPKNKPGGRELPSTVLWIIINQRIMGYYYWRQPYGGVCGQGELIPSWWLTMVLLLQHATYTKFRGEEKVDVGCVRTRWWGRGNSCSICIMGQMNRW